MSFSFGASGGGGTGGPHPHLTSPFLISSLLVSPHPSHLTLPIFAPSHLSSPHLSPPHLTSPLPGGFSFGTGAAPNTTAPAFGAPAATTAATGFSFGGPAASTPGPTGFL